MKIYTIPPWAIYERKMRQLKSISENLQHYVCFHHCTRHDVITYNIPACSSITSTGEFTIILTIVHTRRLYMICLLTQTRCRNVTELKFRDIFWQIRSTCSLQTCRFVRGDIWYQKSIKNFPGKAERERQSNFEILKAIYLWRHTLLRCTDLLQAGRSGHRIPVEGEIFRTRPDRPSVPPTSYTMGTGSFPGIKRSGFGVDHPPPSSPMTEERVGLYQVIGWNFTLHKCAKNSNTLA